MRRQVARILLIAATLVVALPAAAQNGQFPGVIPPVPSQAPAPPAIAPGPAAPQSMPPAARGRSPIIVQRRDGPPVAVPRGRNDSFSDRAANCVHYGAAAGVQPGDIGQFTRDCVND